METIMEDIVHKKSFCKPDALTSKCTHFQTWLYTVIIINQQRGGLISHSFKTNIRNHHISFSMLTCLHLYPSYQDSDYLHRAKFRVMGFPISSQVTAKSSTLEDISLHYIWNVRSKSECYLMDPRSWSSIYLSSVEFILWDFCRHLHSGKGYV